MDNSSSKVKNTICKLCTKSFSSVSTLNRHIKNIHKKKKVNGKQIYICHDCNNRKTFKSRKKFALHWKRTHRIRKNDQTNTKPLCTRRCPTCYLDVPSRDMNSHLISEHHVELEVENLSFPNEKSFEKWKKSIEKESLTKFVLKFTENNRRVKTYGCHRSGSFKSKSRGIRHLKSQGSSKMNAFCPASMKVVQSSDGVRVKFLKTHVGHQNALCHLEISPTKKDEIAFKLSEKVPKRAILREIRDSCTGEVKREHLVTMKDINNIALKHNLGHEYKLDSDDATSIDLRIDDLKKKDPSFVRYYKPQEETCESAPFLLYDDFVLILMNSVQAELLTSFGKNIICVDGTHGMGYDFTLFTIVVFDEYHAGFPAAVMISNRQDAQVLEFFYETVKQVVGRIKARIFMSDMATELFTSWEKVMDAEETIRLFCSWHVRKSWKENLTKINNKDKRTPTFQFLKTVADELDENKFLILLADLEKSFEDDEDLKAYGTYFCTNYSSSEKYLYWAACYRKQAQINTNMSLERMHRTIKYCYFEGKKMNRIDKSVHNLLDFLRDKLFDRLTALHKGNISHKIRLLRVKHKLYDTVSVQPEENDVYLVSSSTGKTMYRVVRNDANCKCKVICVPCKSCIHRYLCTCRDNTIAFNMCKHIHSVCMYEMNANVPLETNANANVNVSLEINTNMPLETNANVLGTIPVSETVTISDNFVRQLGIRTLPNITKKTAMVLFKSILKKCETQTEVKSLYKHLELFQKKIEIGQRFKNRIRLPTARASKPKNIVKQRKLYSTRKTKKNVKYLYEEEIVTI